ncbi:MAG: glycosyltransferase, partial [Nevskiales bacterium]
QLVQGVRWNPDSDSRLDRAFRGVERCLGSLVDLYIANAQASAATLTRACGVPSGKVRVIYNGLADLPAHAVNNDRPLTVVTVANLNARKGYIEYLDVIERLHARLPQARFVFVGRDDMNGRVQQEIVGRGLAGTVSWVGLAEDVGPWLRDARLMVLPSLWGEGCPTSILEGFAWGLPVVAYAVDGVPELIDDGRDGFLVAPDDRAALAVAIERLLIEPHLARRMGEAGRDKVERSFTLQRCVEQHAAAFAALTGWSPAEH